MNWAQRRRAMVFAGAASILVVLGILVSFASFYRLPTCTDHTQNQGEEGVDCGGPCAYVCTTSAASPTVRFVRYLSQNGRTDVIAYVDNPNAGTALQSAPYVLELFDAHNALIARSQGRVDIPAGATVPLFIPGLFSGYRDVSRAFLSFDSAKLRWFHAVPPAQTPESGNIQIENGAMPRITATIQNQTAEAVLHMQVIVTVFDASGTAIAASETYVPLLPPQGSSDVVFTWNTPFSGTPTRVDVVPVLPVHTP